jgi:hypothetical protein
MHAQAQDQGQPLPEPAGLATLAIGALAGWAARRRRAAWLNREFKRRKR